MAKIGLVAGSGTLPIVYANAARKAGNTVIAFAVKEVTAPELADCVDAIHWVEWGDYKKALFLIMKEGVKKIVMLGKIKKEMVMKNDSDLDDTARSFLNNSKDRKDYSILKNVAMMLKGVGAEVVAPTDYLAELLPKKGVLTKRSPTRNEMEDVEFGRMVAKELARFDIGQTVAVVDKTIIAIEAVEGTDETIKRAGALTDRGFSLVKVSRPDQDMRFDIPLVGIQTLQNLIESRGRVLALEERKTFLADKDMIVKLADEKGISVVII